LFALCGAFVREILGIRRGHAMVCPRFVL